MDAEKTIKITVTTTIWNNGEKETFELTTFGRYYEKNDSFYLQYEEHMEEGQVKSIVKVSPKDLLILRSGAAVNMRLVFSTNKKQVGRYDTPFGTMGLEIDTKRITHQVAEEKGMIEILYDLHMQGALAGTYHLEMTYEEEK